MSSLGLVSDDVSGLTWHIGLMFKKKKEKILLVGGHKKIKAGFGLNLLWALLFPGGLNSIALAEPVTFCAKLPGILIKLRTECCEIGSACA